MDKFDLISALRSSIKNEPIKSEIFNWEEVFNLAQRQSVAGFLYPALENIATLPPKEICAKLEYTYFDTIKKMTEYDFVKSKLVSEFDKNKIKAIFFKGTVIKDAYLYPELRTMGDIDILIESSNRKQVDTMLKNMGAKCVKNAEPVYVYEYGNVNLEVHTEFAEDISTKPKAIELCHKISENVTPNSEWTFVPTYEFHLLLILIHTYKHFTGVGCGIRLFMDLGVFYTANKDKINVENIKAKIKEIELENFAKLAFYLNYKWFGYENIYSEKISEELFCETTDYILSCGTFGADFGTTGAKSVRKSIDNKSGANKFLSKIKFFFSRVFPPYKKMKSKYKFISVCPILLPVGWTVNIFSQLKNRGKRLTKYTKDIFVLSDEDKKIYELFNKLNL